MNRKQRTHVVSEILDQLFPHPTPPLQHTNSYTLLIAVLLSAQCSDDRVNQITPHLFAKASTPEAMVNLGVEEIQKIIRPCGLSLRKAQAIHQLSKELTQQYSGIVPSSSSELEALPGVGHKTASVVLAQAFDQSTFPVDRHIFRSARRWGLSSGSSVGAVEADLKRLFPKKLWAKRHLQIILYARQYCPAVRHTISCCPICQHLQDF